MKSWRTGQSRNGSTRRRQLEYDAIMDNVTRRRDDFMLRLTSRLTPIGACVCYQGTLDHKGYARLNISYKPDSSRRQVITIHAHRLFLILKLERPIKRGFEAAHAPECKHRTCVVHLREEHYKANVADSNR